jgi:hypothetical protein
MKAMIGEQRGKKGIRKRKSKTGRDDYEAGIKD